MRILGIETSCDETAVSLIEAQGEFGANFQFTILGEALLSQAALHAPYGGVFPNLAKREHAKNLVPILDMALRDAGMRICGSTDISAHADRLAHILARETELHAQLLAYVPHIQKPAIDALAVTYGPGLEPALWVGINFAKALAEVWGIPIIPVNHMEGHIILSACAELVVKDHPTKLKDIHFPLLSLLISGGHTELVLSPQWMEYTVIGQTRDDAVGEAFDKVARLLDLPYPGGPEISRLASSAREQHTGDVHAEALPDHQRSVVLPRPMIDSKDFDFSFAGLKTAVRRFVDEHKPLSDALKREIAREFEDATAEVLVSKTLKAIREYGVQTVIVGGGVSANRHIRHALADALTSEGQPATLLIPPPTLATDNALMIALAGYFHAGEASSNNETLVARGNLKLA